MRRFEQGLLQRIYISTLKADWDHFNSASQNDVRGTQEKVLLGILKANTNTAFGKKYGFSEISSSKEFAMMVPVADYTDLADSIEAEANGKKMQLVASPIKIFEMTSGSTSKNKKIPFTNDFLKELSHGTNAWLYNMYSQNPKLYGTQSYWSISPVKRNRDFTEGGYPIGMEDDLEYFGPISKFFISRMMAAPSSLAKITDNQIWLRETCRYLTSAKDLGIISIWSPTFLIPIMEEIKKNLPHYTGKRSPPTKETLLGSWLWPKLKVVSCWMDGQAMQDAKILSRWFPEECLVAKGLLATEGIVSIPITGVIGSALAITSHFFEFKNLENEEIVTADNITLGKRYQVLITNSAGLYRYNLKDVIEVVGFFHKNPTIRFIGRSGLAMDLSGEKVSLDQIRELFSYLLNQCPSLNFTLATVDIEKRSYVIYVDGISLNVKSLESQAENFMNQNIHYSYARKMGQLAPLKVISVPNGQRRYLDGLSGSGQRLGDIKMPIFDFKRIAAQVFSKDVI